MKRATLVIGLAPLVLFTALDRRRPAADAAAIAAMAALAAVVVMARSAVPVLPIVQALTLAVISVIALTSDTATHQFRAGYGCGIASLMRAAFMLITVPFASFAATLACANVPCERWRNSRPVALTQRIPALSGLATLSLGLTHPTSVAGGRFSADLPRMPTAGAPPIVVANLRAPRHGAPLSRHASALERPRDHRGHHDSPAAVVHENRAGVTW
jgi:hypothetical protein